MLPAKRYQFGGKFSVCQDARRGLHHSLHFFAEILVGYTKHGNIGHLGKGDRQVSALLRMHVDDFGTGLPFLAGSRYA